MKSWIKKVLDWEKEGFSYGLSVVFTDHAQQRQFERVIGYPLIKVAFETVADELIEVLDTHPIETQVLLRWRKQRLSVALIIMGFDEEGRLEIRVKTVINAFKKNAHDGDVVINS